MKSMLFFTSDGQGQKQRSREAQNEQKTAEVQRGNKRTCQRATENPHSSATGHAAGFNFPACFLPFTAEIHVGYEHFGSQYIPMWYGLIAKSMFSCASHGGARRSELPKARPKRPISSSTPGTSVCSLPNLSSYCRPTHTTMRSSVAGWQPGVHSWINSV